VSDAIDEHLDEAFASLDEVPVRELVATSEALERRKDSLRHFASIFRQVAHPREGGWSADVPRFHLRENVSRADEELAAQIADAPAPFWRHVRDALASGIHNYPPPPRQRLRDRAEIG
jgi:hypothetical protein